MKLGKHPPKIDARTLKLSKYLTTALPTPPPVIDWTAKVGTTWGMMGNDTLGDCTVAAAGHMVEAWTANASTLRVISDADIEAAYNVVDGGVDNGAAMLDVLNYWKATGIGGDNIYAFASIQTDNDTELQDSVDLLCGAYLGLALPDSVVQGDLLASPWDDTVTDPPDPNNGHCVPAVGYDANNVYIVTWGVIKPMSWKFYNAYVDEAYAVLSNDWINLTNNESPSGFDLATLNADLAAIASTSPVVTPPTPTPTPTPPVSVAQQIIDDIKALIVKLEQTLGLK